MRKITFLFIFIVIGTLSLNADQIGKTDDEVQKIAMPITDKLVTYKNNYPDCMKLFSDNTKKIITKEIFDQSVKDFIKNYGKITSYKYLGFLNQGDITATLWKVKCEKSSDDLLMTLVFSKNKNDNIEIIAIYYK